GLASTRTYPLTSSFRPSYNMAVNLVANYERAQAERLLASSFDQFLADRTVHGAEQTLERNASYLAGYLSSAACDRGDDPGGGRGLALADPRARHLAARRAPARAGRGDRPGRRPRQHDRGAGPDRGPPGPPGRRPRPRRRPGPGGEGGH